MTNEVNIQEATREEMPEEQRELHGISHLIETELLNHDEKYMYKPVKYETLLSQLELIVSKVQDTTQDKEWTWELLDHAVHHALRITKGAYELELELGVLPLEEITLPGVSSLLMDIVVFTKTTIEPSFSDMVWYPKLGKQIMENLGGLPCGACRRLFELEALVYQADTGSFQACWTVNLPHETETGMDISRVRVQFSIPPKNA